ncbi:unnamed protein product [Cuscuta campestris]|uniref:J domain-containing protein n=2 Tax=Cuscuta sect. Cleistogrammica TaxID=1824901 RepID=A0A484M8V1_9ASTE|nr:hypothetical protein DM860_002471 [Cuscuta australis]VFQ85270.1 unnamed protein product [Cuscuta campestris]
MECNKEEAIRAKEIAEKKMEGKDFTGALKIASKAHKLYPELDNIEQMILVCDVHCASENKTCGNDSDWYSILKVDPKANGETVKRQYRKFALLLHPDKNKFPGATDAFKMIGEAQKVLLDYEKRSLFDKKRLAVKKPRGQYSSVFPQQPTFWTVCSYCLFKYQYLIEMKGKVLSCQQCKNQFIAHEINTPGQKQNGTNVPQCNAKNNPQTIPVNLTTKGIPGEGKRKVSAETKKEESPKRSKRRVSCSENLNSSKTYETGKISEGMSIEYLCPDLNDFDKQRREECFTAGQVWAFYDVLDAMPRFYGVINKIFLPGFKLQITWLEPDPDDEDEMKWVIEGLPVSCGKFRLGSSETIKHLPMLSHMVCCQKDKNREESYKIYPKKGETWAIFKNWNMNWHSRIKSKTEFEYEFVEVLSHYTDCSSGGVDVALLVKVNGYKCLFTRDEGRGRVRVPVKELFRFSHRIPCFKMKGTEGKGVPKGSLELDPASLPVCGMV